MNLHIGLGRQLWEAQSILNDDNDNTPIEYSPPHGQEPPAESYPEVVLILAWIEKNAMAVKEKLSEKYIHHIQIFHFV